MKETPGEIEEKLLKKAYKYIDKIKNISGIEMIGIGNSISMNTAHKKSDIDLFIVTSPKRLWYVRVMLTFFFQIRGQRKTRRKHAGKFCLSFFCTTDWLNFSKFALEDDIYLYFWILYMKPIVNKNRTYQKFLEANKSWTDYMQFRNTFEKHKRDILYKETNLGETSKIITKIDGILKKAFLPKTLKSFQKLWYPFGVKISDSENNRSYAQVSWSG